VGHDNWASDVIHSVVSNKGGSSAGGSGSNSPQSSGSPVSAGYELTERFVGDLVGHRVRERKRKFHSGRPLELKNLPDNCSEQVGAIFPFLLLLKNFHPIPCPDAMPKAPISESRV
jgi:hypothetical protein